MRFDFELQICTFRYQKRMTLLMQFEHAKSDRILSISESDDASRRILGHQIFKSKNSMLSKFSMLSTTANTSRTSDELDDDTAV